MNMKKVIVVECVVFAFILTLENGKCIHLFSNCYCSICSCVEVFVLVFNRICSTFYSVSNSVFNAFHLWCY